MIEPKDKVERLEEIVKALLIRTQELEGKVARLERRQPLPSMLGGLFGGGQS